MKASGWAGLTAATGLSMAACSGQKQSGPTTSTAPSTAAVDPANSLTWAQWPDYIDTDAQRHPTLDAFAEESGISVDYREVINDNQQYVDSVAGPLQQKAPIGADLVTLTSWMAARLVAAQQVQPLGAVENRANLVAALTRPDWDPGQTYSLPWQAGLTGIAYDARRVDRAIGSVNELFTRTDLKGRVGMLTEFPDSAGMAMLAQGLPVTSGIVADVETGLDRLTELAAAGWFAGFYGNDMMGALRRGNVAAALAWSGDVLQAQARNPYLKFVVPEEGLMIWSDNLMIPAGSTPAAAAAATQLIDYYYRPEVAAKVAAYVQYICPVTGAREALAASDPDLAANPLIFPESSILDVSYQFPTLPETDAERLRGRFAELIG